MARVEGDLAYLRSVGVDVGSLERDDRANRLLVGVTGLTQAATDTLRSRYGSAVTTHELDPIELMAGRRDRQRLRGGLKIKVPGDTSGKSECTSGLNGNILNVISGNKIRAALTAGHCSNSYTTYRETGAKLHNEEKWAQADRQYGETTESTINSGHPKQQMDGGKRSTDAVSIVIGDRKDATNFIYAGPSRVRRVTEEATTDNDKEGEVWISRGEMSDRKNEGGKVREIHYVQDSARQPKVYNSRIVKGTRCVPGDSGSPVYRITGPHGAEAMGLMFARVKRTEECVYSHIRHIRDEIAFAVYTASRGQPGQD
jgi:hypothetical protein